MALGTACLSYPATRGAGVGRQPVVVKKVPMWGALEQLNQGKQSSGHDQYFGCKAHFTRLSTAQRMSLFWYAVIL